MICVSVTMRTSSVKKNGVLHRKGPVVRAEIDTALFARFSALNEQLPVIEVAEQARECACSPRFQNHD